MVSSEELYNKFAPYYRLYSKKRDTYIKSVDKLILKNLPMRKIDLLDIGCGDGVRGMRLFRKIGGERILMIDNSSEMIKLAKKFTNQRIKVKRCDITHPKLNLESQFDIILCLWNVLGHIPTVDGRLTALRNMRQQLRSDGRIFIDISNRYNIRHYGLIKVLSNIIKDILRPNPRNGDFNYKIVITKDNKLDSTCYFFNPFEVKSLIKKAGLIVEKEYSVDYETGQLRNTFLEGHLLYILLKSNRDKY